MRIYLGDVAVLAEQFTTPTGFVDLTGATVYIDLYGPNHIQALATILDAPTDGKVQYQLLPNVFKVVGDYSGRWVTHTADGLVTSYPGVIVRVMDPADLAWANLINLETIVGPIEDPEKAAAALDSATRAVKSYIFIQPDPDEPIPPRITMATTMLAATFYTGPTVGEQVVASEGIGDYRVSYQFQNTAAGLAIMGNPVLVDLLAPWRPRLTNAYIGPELGDPSLPITSETDWSVWFEWNTATTTTITEDDMILDMSPAVLDIEGVRAGDKNERTFTLTQGGEVIDLTDAVVEAQARQHYSDTAPAITAVVEIIDPTSGRFALSWPGDQVASALGEAETWSGVWDLQVTGSGEDLPVTVLAGSIECVADVTR